MYLQTITCDAHYNYDHCLLFAYRCPSPLNGGAYYLCFNLFLTDSWKRRAIADCQPCVTSPVLLLDDGQGWVSVQGQALGIESTGTPWWIRVTPRACVLPWTWCVTWLGGAECHGQHSSQPHTVGLREDLSLCSGLPADPGTLV